MLILVTLIQLSNIHHRNPLKYLAIFFLSFGFISCASFTNSNNREVAYAAGTESSNELQTSKKLLALTNSHRQKIGRKKLAPQPYLKALAKEHSEFLARRHNEGGNIHEYSHAGVQQRSFSARNRVKLAVSENVAWYKSPRNEIPERMFEKLLGSKSHRRAIEKKGWTVIGTSTTKAKDGTYYAVQIFGRPYVEKVLPARTIFL